MSQEKIANFIANTAIYILNFIVFAWFLWPITQCYGVSLILASFMGKLIDIDDKLKKWD